MQKSSVYMLLLFRVWTLWSTYCQCCGSIASHVRRHSLTSLTQFSMLKIVMLDLLWMSESSTFLHRSHHRRLMHSGVLSALPLVGCRRVTTFQTTWNSLNFAWLFQ